MEHEQTIRSAAEERRRLCVRFRSPEGRVYEREMEPYGIRGGNLVAFSYYRDEFREVPLADILSLTDTGRRFDPRPHARMSGLDSLEG
jgi:predicted DNA-binding transcriptional regulator YafY